jgi:hypothetical protein
MNEEPYILLVVTTAGMILRFNFASRSAAESAARWLTAQMPRQQVILDARVFHDANGVPLPGRDYS